MARAPRAVRANAQACLLTLALSFAAAPDASAAVRLCGQPVSSGPVKGATERAAKIDALAAWKALASRQGEGYTAWRLAADKLLKCLPSHGGGFECLASARPCTIEQAPDRRELRRKRIGI